MPKPLVNRASSCLSDGSRRPLISLVKSPVEHGLLVDASIAISTLFSGVLTQPE